MKLIGILLFVLVGCLYAANVYVKGSGDHVDYSPANIRTITIAKGDTLDSAGSKIYGPFIFAKDRNRATPQYLKETIAAGALTSGDSIETRYQVTLTKNLSDTTSWTAIDTFDGSAENGIVTDVSAKIGSHIWFLITNRGATGVRIAKGINIGLKEAMTSSPDTYGK